MNRRGFLQSMLAACAAPMIVRADSLMRIAAPAEGLILPLGLAGVVREVRMYDVNRDEFLMRWDVMGMVGGVRQQFHVGLVENDDPRGAVDATYGKALFVHGADSVASRGQAQLSANREIALAALRSKIASSGMVAERGVLELPQGLTHARFL